MVKITQDVSSVMGYHLASGSGTKASRSFFKQRHTERGFQVL
jgi:hypothetical protein